MSLPILAQATLQTTRADGAVETAKATAGTEPIAFTAHVGDTVRIQSFSLAGNREGCSCGAGPSGRFAPGALALMGLAWAVVRRRIEVARLAKDARGVRK